MFEHIYVRILATMLCCNSVLHVSLMLIELLFAPSNKRNTHIMVTYVPVKNIHTYIIQARMIFIHIIKLTLTIYQVYQLVIYWPALNKQGENSSHMPKTRILIVSFMD